MVWKRTSWVLAVTVQPPKPLLRANRISLSVPSVVYTLREQAVELAFIFLGCILVYMYVLGPLVACLKAVATSIGALQVGLVVAV